MSSKKRPFFSIPFEYFSPLEFIVVGLFLAMVILCLFLEFGYTTQLYKDMHGWLWLFTGLLYILGFGQPLARLGTSREALKKQVFAFALLIIAVLVLGLYFIVGLKAEGTGLFTPLAAVVSTLVVGLGWLIHASTASRYQRRQHTMTVLLGARLSPEYQQNLRRLKSYYPHGSVIPEADAERFFKQPKSFVTKNEKRQFRNIEAVLYLLNYYEFLAVAVRHGDLEDEVLRDCLDLMAKLLHTKAQNVIAYAKILGGPTAFIDFEQLLDRWSKRPATG